MLKHGCRRRKLMTGAPYACAAQFVCVASAQILTTYVVPPEAWTVLVSNGCAGTGCLPGLVELDDFAARDDLAGDDGDGAVETLLGGAPLVEIAVPLRGPAPVPLPAICEAQPAPSATHAAVETA